MYKVFLAFDSWFNVATQNCLGNKTMSYKLLMNSVIIMRQMLLVCLT